MDGFLMQQTDFPIEILIHDDCSTDGTTEIIKEYAAQYPDLIFPLYEEVNQYQQGKATEIDFYNYRRARGKYIAYCEGDDYWTEPLKLQKQVDFMESNPEYSVCFHNFHESDIYTRKIHTIHYKNKPDVYEGGCDVTPMMYFSCSYWGQPLTMLFRVSMFSFEWSEKYCLYRDVHEIYHLLREGKGYFMDFIGGVYVRHDGGVATSLETRDIGNILIETYLELYRVNPNDLDIKDALYNALLWNYEIHNNSITYLFKSHYLVTFPCIILKTLLVICKRKVKSLFHLK